MGHDRRRRIDERQKTQGKVAAAMEEATGNFGIAIARDPSNECHKFASNCHAKDGAASENRQFMLLVTG